MACGCAVVASDTGAFKTIVDEGKTGYVVPTDDVAELTKAIRQLMDAPSAIAMGKQGRERVATQFTVDNEASGIGTVYSSIWQA
jgi:mannosyltransferase